LTQVARISAGRLHTCAQLTDGSAKCWGYNALGQLGDGTVQQRTSPVTVLDVGNFVELNGGYTFTCGLTQTGRVKCWGDNTEGQLGNGNSNWTVPMNVAGLSGVGGLMQASMALHQCAVLSTGGGRCWGDNGEGQLGDNSATNRNYQVVVSGLAAAVSMSGGAYHSCALLQDGTGRCWGRNLEGQLGDTTFVAKRLTPVTVAKVTAATAVAAQASATCWPAKDGTVQCSGLNSTGGLGDGSLVNKSTVSPVQGL
jgi:alpha-tubulin suppressor-like RCC1 family protein